MELTGKIRSEAVEPGVAANARLTALTGVLLLVLLAAMGVTVLRVKQLLPEHLVLGFILIPPLALKAASTGYRFVRYYSGSPPYRRAGPPEWTMRLLSPVVVLLTVALFITGLELWFFGLRFGSVWVGAHKLSFILWLPAIAIHVLWNIRRTTVATGDELASTGPPGVWGRRSLVIASLVAGIALALATLSYQSPFIVFHDAG